MRHLTSSCAVAALMSAAFAQGAAADITAEEAWTTLRDMMTGSGYESSATESRDGDALVISDTVFTMSSDDADATTSVDFGTLRFVETGDGSVTVEMPEVLPVISSFSDPETGEEVTLHMDVIQKGASLALSGDPDNVTQTYAASSVEVALTSIDAPDEALAPDAVKVSMIMQGLTSDTTIGSGEPRPVEMSAKATSVSFDMGVDMEDEGSGAAKGEMTDVSFTGTATLPSETSAGGDLVELMQDGYMLDGTFSHQGSTVTFSGEGDGSTFEAQSSSESGEFDMNVDAESLTYALRQVASSIAVTTSDLPFPLEVQAAGLEAGFTLPLAESEEPKDFALLVNLQDFVMSDMIWMMFDPEGVLPRDPASLMVDLAGQAKLFVNLLDSEETEELAATGAAPGQLEAIDINAIKLDLVGASLNGSGSFTFDNSDLATFGGMPKPTGSLDLSLAGGNALLDKLMTLGVIGEEEAGGARMMMGLLAVPGDEPDTLNSKLEINEQGHITANGQRIQ
ncbi:DUF2125 domain-containing protein [Marinibacterium profundimaris]|uniref:DUF2125 domain-containing protein n=1 Tax=Marinibacterium profundimaris TaxID=1679460 RepID=UPI000B5238B9|nr:DUF2125 domain-containing protein [Marinibacterium profundimaris]